MKQQNIFKKLFIILFSLILVILLAVILWTDYKFWQLNKIEIKSMKIINNIKSVTKDVAKNDKSYINKDIRVNNEVVNNLELAQITIGQQIFLEPEVIGRVNVVWPLFTVPPDQPIILKWNHAVDLESLFKHVKIIPERLVKDDLFIVNPKNHNEITLTFNPPLTTDSKVSLKLKPNIKDITGQYTSQKSYYIVLTTKVTP